MIDPIHERGGRGEITKRVITQGNQTLLSEVIGWRGEAKIDNYNLLDNLLGMPQEARNYAYDDRGRLGQEPYFLGNTANSNLTANSTQVAQYAFDEAPLQSDGGRLDGLGVRTSQRVGNFVADEVSQENTFFQVTSDTASLESAYDAEGDVTARSLGNNTQQKLTCDSFGRLVAVDRVNNQGGGYHWKTIYDGLGRCLQTSYRDAGQGNLWPKQNNIFYPAYTDASNYSVGLYMRGAGYTLFGADLVAMYYALKTGSILHAFSNQMSKWWANRWNAANAGIPNGI